MPPARTIAVGFGPKGAASPALYLGLGIGGTERLVGYPGNLWMLIGLVTITRRASVITRMLRPPMLATSGLRATSRRSGF
jgi:hypothetical protein